MVLVKICGLKDIESAQVAIDNGADLLGMIVVPGRARTIDDSVAKEIVSRTKSKRLEEDFTKGLDQDNWTDSVVKSISMKGPFSVGVFRNQSIEDINSKIEEIGFDFVQLHGKENRSEYISKLNRPVITRYVPNDAEIANVMNAEQILTLFDTEFGGTGTQLNWEDLGTWSKMTRSKYILAGGLNPENVGEASKIHGVIGVDVASGVETNGVKDHEKIRQFIKNAKTT